MNPRQAEARVIELTTDVRAVEATAVKQRQNIIAEALTAADGLKLVKENAESLTGRVSGAIKVGRERHDENKTAFAEIRDWQTCRDVEIGSLSEQVLHLRNATEHSANALTGLQTQIDCCFPKPGPYGWLIILAGLLGTSIAGHAIFHGLLQ